MPVYLPPSHLWLGSSDQERGYLMEFKGYFTPDLLVIGLGIGFIWNKDLKLISVHFLLWELRVIVKAPFFF